MVVQKPQIVPQASGRMTGGDHPVGNEESRMDDLFLTIDFYAVVVCAKQHAHESSRIFNAFSKDAPLGMSQASHIVDDFLQWLAPDAVGEHVLRRLPDIFRSRIFAPVVRRQSLSGF